MNSFLTNLCFLAEARRSNENDVVKQSSVALERGFRQIFFYGDLDK